MFQHHGGRWTTSRFVTKIKKNNKRYFYQLDGEGIRYELVAFARASQEGRTNYSYVTEEESIAICKVMEDYLGGDVVEI